ncbi:MAG: hypothetical protein H0T79_19155 [Deltaproteobacteria bacterium]|nr:hypothetical protein [Deltaproteobacteria bacterium]
MKTDDPAYLDVKLTVIAKLPEPWLEALAMIGAAEVDEEVSGWRHLRVETTAVLQSRKIRVLAYIGPSTADVTVGFVGADRVISDGSVEIPDVSLAAPPQIVGPPTKDTWMTALKAVLKDAANTTA